MICYTESRIDKDHHLRLSLENLRTCFQVGQRVQVQDVKSKLLCIITNSTSYTEAWEKTIGTKLGTLFVNLCIIIKPALGCIAYSMILADSIQSLCVATGIGIGFDITRTISLLGKTVTAILPLCLIQSSTSLTIFSFIGSYV
jgi:hypothetical protein